VYLKSQLLRAALAASVSSVSLLSAAPAFAQETETAVEAPDRDVVVVTAQRREERLQDVPISVSAFSDDLLNERGIDGGPNLQLAVPNVTFAKSYYSGYNFQIRGIGTKQTAVTGDSSTGVHFNGAPLTSNRLFEAEFFDVERVEVLRGPQGTLYGRNATGGVVNVISARPTYDFEGMVRAEATSLGGRKMRAMVNIPLIDDQLALRLAGASFTRDGIVDNLGTDNKVDDRNLYSVRASLLWEPTSKLDFNLVWQHFNEEDNRLRTGKGLCTRDNGPSSVGTTAVTNAVVRGFLSQGCADASVYTDAAYGTPNSLTSLYGLLAYSRGLASGDIYGNRQPNSLSVIDAAIDPEYKAREDVATLTANWDITDELTLTSLTSYYVGFLDARQEENRFSPAVNFNSTALAPGGVINDPQLGASNRLIIADSIQTPSRQTSQEIRLQPTLPVRSTSASAHSRSIMTCASASTSTRTPSLTLHWPRTVGRTALRAAPACSSTRAASFVRTDTVTISAANPTTSTRRQSLAKSTTILCRTLSSPAASATRTTRRRLRTIRSASSHRAPT